MVKIPIRDLLFYVTIETYDPATEVYFSKINKNDYGKMKLGLLEIMLIDVCKEHIKILKFIHNVSDFSSSSVFLLLGNKNIKQGEYFSAFVNGIKLIKNRFHKELITVKSNYLKSPTITLNSDLKILLEILQTYQKINNIIQEVIDLKLSSCQISDLCLKYIFASPEIAPILKILTKKLNAVFLKQIRMWILHGELNDLYGEFFVQKKNISCEEDSLTYNAASSMNSSSFSELCTSLNTSTLTKLPFTLASDDDGAEYELEASNVPSSFSYSLTCKILSVGNLLVLLKHAPSDGSSDPFSIISVENYGLNESEIVEKLNTLAEGDTFDTYLLENIINDIWLGLNKYLKQVACNIGGLNKEFQTVTDMFMLGRIELFKEFINKVKPILRGDASTIRSLRLNLALESACYDLYGKKESFLDKFSFSLPSRSHISRGTLVIDAITMNYKTVWPLHLIFTPEILKQYNIIYRFLLNLKCVHMNVLSIYCELGHTQNGCKSSEIRLHQLLDSFLVNLQEYVFVDVILSEKYKFEQVLESTESFDEIQTAHALYLSNITSQLFLIPLEFSTEDEMSSIYRNESLVQERINSLLSVSRKYCCLITELCTDGSLLEGVFDHLVLEAESLICDIVFLVDSINEKYSAEHLSRLIMRIDYNSYFTNSRSQVSS